MSAHGLEVFDRTLETTHIWLNEISRELGPDKHVAWKVLSVVLQKLRDRLPLPLAAHLGAQLPLLVRGVYYDQFEPGRMLNERRSRDEFVAEVHDALSDTRPVNPDQAIRCVFGVLSRHISEGQVRKICDALPHGLKQLWPTAEELRSAETGRDAAAKREGARPFGDKREFTDARERREDEPLILTEEQQV
ncbi:MAG TPA: DUF2267 domain-containing protein [Sphingomicrobium sp.]|nr:DUF2267 domain-containing protein [Sphingomicrobium sp.]